MAWVPDSLPDSQRYNDYGLEATQLSQPAVYSQASQFANSQVEPRRKYWAILIPINPSHSILKIPWTRMRLQIGRGAEVGNTVILHEKRISNRHCRIQLGIHGNGAPVGGRTEEDILEAINQLKESEAEPEVWIEDLKSSNGTFVNGQKVKTRRMLIHGDEVSLGLQGTAEHHDVRYIFRSVGPKGSRLGDDERAPGAVYQQYQILATLGKGTFAEVKKAVDVDTGDLRAIKQIIRHRFDNNQKTLDMFQREIDICTSLHHENICRLIDWYTDPQHICLVLEYIDGGDLLDYIMKWEGEGIPESEAAELAFQICRAMAYCHENGVTHRDLKPENILLTKETETTGRIIKIADFGLAKMVHSQTMLVSMVGTPQYLAPEVVMQSRHRPGYENVVDSWSVGIIVYSMLTKALPFDEPENMNVEQRIRHRYSVEYDREPLHQMNVSDQCIDFITRLLERDPAKRMTMADALEHEWLSGPSSLPNESPSQVLGGDSMWNIQSFESEHDIEDEDRGARWSRPMTESTNFEASGSGDSFSQPMEGLRINSVGGRRLTPASGDGERKEPTAGGRGRRQSDTAAPSPDPDTSIEPDNETNGNGNLDEAGEVTPKKSKGKANGMDVDSVTPPLAAMSMNPVGIPPISSMAVDTPAASTAASAANGATSAVGQKRKQQVSFFSSGSLSPPPEDRDRDATPQPGAVADAAPRRLTRSATARAAGNTPPKAPTTTPPSARAGRARKSQRLG